MWSYLGAGPFPRCLPTHSSKPPCLRHLLTRPTQNWIPLENESGQPTVWQAARRSVQQCLRAYTLTRETTNLVAARLETILYDSNSSGRMVGRVAGPRGCSACEDTIRGDGGGSATFSVAAGDSGARARAGCHWQWHLAPRCQSCCYNPLLSYNSNYMIPQITGRLAEFTWNFRELKFAIH